MAPKERFLLLPSPSGAPLVIERGEPDVCYINQGAGRFAPVLWHIGVLRDPQGRPLTQTPTDWGLAVLFRDLNGDRLPDLYVCNDFVYWPDRVWLNRGARYFQAAPVHAFRTFSLASMTVDAADINRDGFDDLFISDMLSPHREQRAWQRPDTLEQNVRWPRHDPDFTPELPRNTLHLARGDGTYAEIAQLAGVAATDWTAAAAFLDVDLDGWEDLLLVTGNKHDLQDADALAALGDSIRQFRTPAMRQRDRARLPHRRAPSLAFRNRHDLTFEDVSARWGFDAVGVAHGIALGDLDNDGDLDVVVNAMNEPARLYRNHCPAPRLAVRLRGLAENTRGVGARLTIRGGPAIQTQEIMAGGRFCSSDDAMRVFAAGLAARLELEVAWRRGRRSVLTNLAPNHIYEVIEAEAAAPPPPEPASPAPLFEDVSSRLQHVHEDVPFDDFARQPLLPRRLSTLGPGVAWADLDRDGWDDLVIAGGRGGRCAVFRNRGTGELTEWEEASLPRANARDQTAVLVWRGEDQRPRLVAGESSWEDSDPAALPFRVALLDRNGGEAAATAFEFRAATGPLALADVDSDGDLDLFVTQYSGPTRLFRNAGGKPGVRVRLSGPAAAKANGPGRSVGGGLTSAPEGNEVRSVSVYHRFMRNAGTKRTDARHPYTAAPHDRRRPSPPSVPPGRSRSRPAKALWTTKSSAAQVVRTSAGSTRHSLARATLRSSKGSAPSAMSTLTPSMV